MTSREGGMIKIVLARLWVTGGMRAPLGLSHSSPLHSLPRANAQAVTSREGGRIKLARALPGDLESFKQGARRESRFRSLKL